MNSQIHIAIAFDRNYLSPFYALVTSVLRNNRDERITIHAIATGVDEHALAGIKTFVERGGQEIVFYQIDEAQLKGFTLTNNWTHAVYYRLLFPFVVPDTLKRLLYIDTDTLVVNSLRELYHADLEGHPVGAVYDNYVVNHPEIGVEGEGNYFNSGVLLMDLEQWKKQRITERSFDYLNAYPERIRFVDQDALNAVLITNWKKLPVKFNLMYSCIPQDYSKIQLREFIKDKVIVHFTLQRPWNSLCANRYRDLYHAYLNASCAPDKRKYTDFDLSKLRPMLSIRLKEFYHDNPRVKKLWQSVKGMLGLGENVNAIKNAQ